MQKVERKNSKIIWLPEHDQFIDENWGNLDMPIRDIAAALGCSSTAATWRAEKLGKAPRKARFSGQLRAKRTEESEQIFEDDPRLVNTRSRANAAKRGSLYRQTREYPSPGMEAMPHGNGARHVAGKGGAG